MLLKLLENEESDNVFIIGGERIYRELAPYCDTAYVTIVDAEREADKYLVNFDEAQDWEVAESSPVHEHEGITFKFVTYKRK